MTNSSKQALPAAAILLKTLDPAHPKPIGLWMSHAAHLVYDNLHGLPAMM